MVSKVGQNPIAHLYNCAMATTTVVSKLAIQAIILGSAVYAAWVLVPVAFHAVVIPTVTALSALAGAFLFTPDAQKAKASLPLDAPRGLVNETGQDCAINSVRQLLRGDKEISEWFQSIPEEGANAETVEQFAARYGLGDGFVASYNGPGPAERGSPRAAFLTDSEPT